MNNLAYQGDPFRNDLPQAGESLCRLFYRGSSGARFKNKHRKPPRRAVLAELEISDPICSWPGDRGPGLRRFAAGEENAQVP